MTKKGFTLVELLGVIVLIAIVSGLAVLSMNGVIGSGKNGLYKNYEKVMKGAAENYLSDYNKLIPPVGGYHDVTILALVGGNYIDEFKDPNGGDCSNSYVRVTRSNDVSNNYSLTYNICLVCKDSSNNINYITSGDC